MIYYANAGMGFAISSMYLHLRVISVLAARIWRAHGYLHHESTRECRSNEEVGGGYIFYLFLWMLKSNVVSFYRSHPSAQANSLKPNL